MAHDIIKTMRRYSPEEQATVISEYIKGSRTHDSLPVTPIEHFMLLDVVHRYRMARNGRSLEFFTIEVSMPFVKTIAWADLDM